MATVVNMWESDTDDEDCVVLSTRSLYEDATAPGPAPPPAARPPAARPPAARPPAARPPAARPPPATSRPAASPPTRPCPATSRSTASRPARPSPAAQVAPPEAADNPPEITDGNIVFKCQQACAEPQLVPFAKFAATSEQMGIAANLMRADAVECYAIREKFKSTCEDAKLWMIKGKAETQDEGVGGSMFDKGSSARDGNCTANGSGERGDSVDNSITPDDGSSDEDEPPERDAMVLRLIEDYGVHLGPEDLDGLSVQELKDRLEFEEQRQKDTMEWAGGIDDFNESDGEYEPAPKRRKLPARRGIIDLDIDGEDIDGEDTHGEDNHGDDTRGDGVPPAGDCCNDFILDENGSRVLVLRQNGETEEDFYCGFCYLVNGKGRKSLFHGFNLLQDHLLKRYPTIHAGDGYLNFCRTLFDAATFRTLVGEKINLATFAGLCSMVKKSEETGRDLKTMLKQWFEHHKRRGHVVYDETANQDQFKAMWREGVEYIFANEEARAWIFQKVSGWLNDLYKHAGQSVPRLELATATELAQDDGDRKKTTCLPYMSAQKYNEERYPAAVRSMTDTIWIPRPGKTPIKLCTNRAVLVALATGRITEDIFYRFMIGELFVAFSCGFRDSSCMRSGHVILVESLEMRSEMKKCTRDDSDDDHDSDDNRDFCNNSQHGPCRLYAKRVSLRERVGMPTDPPPGYAMKNADRLRAIPLSRLKCRSSGCGQTLKHKTELQMHRVTHGETVKWEL